MDRGCNHSNCNLTARYTVTVTDQSATPQVETSYACPNHTQEIGAQLLDHVENGILMVQKISDDG